MTFKKKAVYLQRQTNKKPKNSKIMEDYQKKLAKKIQENCVLKSEDYNICGTHFSWCIIEETPIHVLIDKNREKFTIMIGYDVWRVPTYLNNIFSINDIIKALMQKF